MSIRLTLNDPNQKKLSDSFPNIDWIDITPNGARVYFNDENLVRTYPWWRIWNVEETEPLDN
jgi:hypothetical protein